MLFLNCVCVCVFLLISVFCSCVLFGPTRDDNNVSIGSQLCSSEPTIVRLQQLYIVGKTRNVIGATFTTTTYGCKQETRKRELRRIADIIIETLVTPSKRQNNLSSALLTSKQLGKPTEISIKYNNRYCKIYKI